MNGYRALPTSLRRIPRLMALSALLLVIGGCSGITPDGALRNNREEGPEEGLFSGPGGEFVIVAPAARAEKAGN